MKSVAIRAGGRGIEKIFPRFLADLFTKSINWRSNYGVGGYIVESCDIKPTQAKDCRKCIKYSKWLRHECMELGLQYVDTSYNRRQILNDVARSLDLGDS